MFTMLLGSMLQVIIRIMGNNAADQLISNFSEVLPSRSMFSTGIPQTNLLDITDSSFSQLQIIKSGL